MRTLTLLTTALFAVGWTSLAVAQVPDCTAEDEGVTCPKERFQLLRDKARVGQLLCEALETGTLTTTLPERLQAVCESASLTSRIWADARTKQKHAEAAREAQRAANVKEGRIVQLEGTNDDLLVRVEELSADRREARESRDRWRIIGLSAGGLAALSTVATVGHLSGWWELPSPP